MEAHAACREEFQRGTSRPLRWRKEQLLALQAMLEENEAAFCDALQKDLGKPVTESWLHEISFVVSAAKYAAKHLKRWAADKRKSTPVYARPGRCWIHTEPLGVVLIISPWNYPLQLCLAPLVSAISAGNCTVIKPSELSPATAALLGRLIPQYLDKSCIRVVEGGVDVASSLLECAWDHIVFTGGEHVARVVMGAAAKHLTPVTLELGGKSPCVVLADADLEIAARRITWGRFTNSGQTCVAPDHILTDPGTAKKLIPLLKREIEEMFGEDPRNSSDYGRIINEAHHDRVAGLIDPQKVVIGGGMDRDERYISPTVLFPSTRGDRAMQEEIFGPVLPIMEVSGLDQAIKYITSGNKPLAAYLFSRSNRSMQEFVRSVSAGTICMNDVMMFIAIDSLPFGGVGTSGMGVYNGEEGFRQLSHEKAVLKRSFRPDLRMRYAPFGKRKMKWLRMLRG
jgi:aldehyde dehydrogenase (NAD+)